jgi:C4-dicarboxylate-specific signal transduction histidine kinase
LQRHDYARAIEMFSAVLKGAADDLDALNGLAEAYKGKGDLDRALGYLEQIRRRHRTPQGQLERKLRALQLERERRDAELLRVRNIAALNLMATGIAHELRQPLSLIRLAAQNARKDLEEGEQTYLQQDLADIDRSVAQIDKVIAVLRDISSPEGPTDEVVDLAEVLDEALSLFRTQLSHREIAIETNDLAGQRVLASRAALRQVLVNLISNARDALESTHEKRIRIWAIQGTSDYRIYFQDNGCGMDAAIRDQAFDPFFTTKKDGGTGLGLYICHSLMRRMGGSISLKETAPGRGAKFELRLHRAPDPSDAALKEAADEREDQ